MKIVSCPTCRIRVLPRSDGTCPRCHRDVSHLRAARPKQRFGLRERSDDRAWPDLPVVRRNVYADEGRSIEEKRSAGTSQLLMYVTGGLSLLAWLYCWLVSFERSFSSTIGAVAGMALALLIQWHAGSHWILPIRRMGSSKAPPLVTLRRQERDQMQAMEKPALPVAAMYIMAIFFLVMLENVGEFVISMLLASFGVWLIRSAFYLKRGIEEGHNENP